MPNNTLMKRSSGAVQSRDYKTEILSFLERMILQENDRSDEKHDEFLEAVEKIYSECLKRITVKVSRIPTFTEIEDGLMEYNYKILWQLAEYDLKNGLGEYGLADQIDFEIGWTDHDKLREVFDCYINEYAFDLGFGVDVYFEELLDELDFCYIDDLHFLYHTESTVQKALYMNDCQNILFPDWHFASIYSRNNDDEDKIMRMRFTDEKIMRYEPEEDEDE